MSEDLQHPVVIVCGGPAPDGKAIECIPTPATVIAVDSGLDHARNLRLSPDLLIGDLDSISSGGLHWAKKQGIRIKEFPNDKDKSDFELALDYARGISNRLFVIGSDSGRVDQLFGIIAALGSVAPVLDSCHALLGSTYFTFISDTADVYRNNGTIVSVYSMGGVAEGVSLQGFRWELTGATFLPGSTHGLSNEIVDEVGKISVSSGVVAAIQPDST